MKSALQSVGGTVRPCVRGVHHHADGRDQIVAGAIATWESAVIAERAVDTRARVGDTRIDPGESGSRRARAPIGVVPTAGRWTCPAPFSPWGWSSTAPAQRPNPARSPLTETGSSRSAPGGTTTTRPRTYGSSTRAGA